MPWAVTSRYVGCSPICRYSERLSPTAIRSASSGASENIWSISITRSREKKVLIAGTYSAHSRPDSSGNRNLKEIEGTGKRNLWSSRTPRSDDGSWLKGAAVHERFSRNSRSTGDPPLSSILWGRFPPIGCKLHSPTIWTSTKKYRTLLIERGIFHFPLPHQTGEHLLRPHGSGH